MSYVSLRPPYLTGQTAAELIHDKADKSKDHMGLETWKNSPEGRIIVSDVTVAKNLKEQLQLSLIILKI